VAAGGVSSARAQLFPASSPSGAPEEAATPFSRPAQDYTKPRTFTDSRGQAVTATVEGIEAGGIVALKKEGGGPVRAKVLDLSQDDQQYIRGWYTEKVLAKGQAVRVKAVRGKGDKKVNKVYPGQPIGQGQGPGGFGGPGGMPTPPKGAGIEITTQEAFYEVTLTNTGPLSLEKPKVEYYLFKKVEDSGQSAFGYVEEPAMIGSQKSAEFRTEVLNLTVDGTVPGGGGGGGGRKEKNEERLPKESLSGLWVRVYEGETLVGEFADPVAVKQNNTWPPGPLIAKGQGQGQGLAGVSGAPGQQPGQGQGQGQGSPFGNQPPPRPGQGQGGSFPSQPPPQGGQTGGNQFPQPGSMPPPQQGGFPFPGN
jgi:hypothetical protein